MTELRSGQSLATRFTLIRRLGRGGMGDVWLARDEDLDSDIVTKIVATDATEDQIALLRQECRSARRLNHPNIVRVFDFHQDPAVTFITMEHVEGGDIGRLRTESPQKIVEALLPLVDALSYAHGEGVIHRDLKTSNVLVDGSGRLRLSDFGVAGVADPGAEDLQLSGGGSRHHASPQQLAGAPASPADDLYGLGALLADLLMESRPLPEDFLRLVERLMAPEPEDRPESMATVRAAFEKLMVAELDEGTIPPQVAKREVRLTPPPRVPVVRSSEPVVLAPAEIEEAAAKAWHPHRWLTVAAFLALVVVTFAVFVLLPDWVKKRESGASQEAGVGESNSNPVATGAEQPPSPEPMDPVEQEPAAAILEPTPVEAETPEPQQEEKTPPPLPTPPPVAVPRIDPTVAAFSEAMSTGLAALESDDFEAAKQAFGRALSLAPESAQAADGLAQSEQAIRLVGIAHHRERAEAFEKEERWHEAKGEYAAALALDSTVRFAQVGQKRAGSRAELADKLIYHVGHPDRLAEDRVLSEAREALEQARSIDPRTPELGNQIVQLEKVIEIATTPVQVVLISDNLTEVVVYRVGRLGKFERRAIDLRPGTYTVVGTRDGYRDVRRRLQVEPNAEIEPLTVRCEEEV